MLIAISTYNEPAVVSAAASSAVANEPLQSSESDELEEIGAFSNLLKDLLKQSETRSPEDDFEFSGIQTDVKTLAVEKTDFSNLKKIQKSFAQDASDTEIPEEHMGVFYGMGVMFNLSEPEKMDTDSDFLPEISNLIVTDHLPETELGQDFFEFASAKTAEAVVSQTAAASSVEEGLFYEAAGKKEKLFNEKTVKEDHTLSKNEINNIFTANETRSENSGLLRKDTTDDKPGRFDDMRSRSRRDRVSFEVRDMRTGQTNEMNRSYSVVETAATRSLSDAPVREITLELKLPDYNSSSMGQNQAQTTWEAKAGTAMENMLARELHQNFNGDIVRHASIALRDGGEGTIKIALKPESLGNVKIRLEMTENKITGIIIVESEEALNAFRKEISSLEQAFKESGFTSADLNLSLTSNGQDTQWEQEQGSFTPRMIASLYDDTYEYDAVNMVDVFVGRNSGSINMLA